LKLHKISISNFRNINQLEYQAGPGLNVFMGDNAQGKTNLLEAIYVTAASSSFRTNNDRLLVQYEKPAYNIRALHSIDNRNIATEIEYHLQRGKTIKINSKKTNQNNPNRLRVVVFTPDDLYLVKGSPSGRRNYLDYILKEISNEYRLLIENYYKILRKRNEWLRNNKGSDRTYDLLNELFAEYSAKIISARINMVNLLDRLTTNNYLQISQEEEEVKLKYALSFPVQDDKVNHITLCENLLKYIAENRENEVRRRNTLAGPHLDDINIYLKNKPARLFASQGQQRNIAVSLKMSEVYAFKEIIDLYPVLLLDEVLAEFDNLRKGRLLEQLKIAEYQSFLTSVMTEMISSNQAKISRIKTGGLLEIDQDT
jgi:DNA replication and repair protein RecF